MERQSLFERLQGRKMFQWLIAYAAVAWGITEATGFLIDNYGLPRALLDVILFLLVVGFCALLVLVWFHGRRGRQRVTRVEGALLGVLAVVAIAGSLRILATNADARPVFAAAEPIVADLGEGSVAVLPFRSSVQDAELAWMARGIPELLATHLAGVGGLRVVSGQRVFDVLRQLGIDEDAAVPEAMEGRVTRLAGARLAVAGSVFGEDGDLAITATLSDVETGEIRASASARGSDVFALVDDISRGLQRRLGTGPTRGDATTAQLTTGDVEAYRAYEEGRRAMLRFRYRDAVTHLRRAVEIDPDFALARFRLGLALLSAGRVFEATEQVERAREGLGHVSERDSLFIEGVGGFQRDTTTSIAALRRLVALYPDEKDGRILFASLLAGVRGSGDPEARRLLSETLRLDPYYAAGYNMLAYSYAGTGDMRTADSLIGRYAELEPDEPNPLDSRGEIYELAGRREEARDAFLEALRVQPDFLSSLDHLTRLHLSGGEPGRARADLSDRLDSPSPDVRVRARSLVGDSYAWEGDLDAALEAYEDAEREAVAAERPDLRAWPLQDIIRMHLALGRYAEATEAAQEIRTVQPLSGWWITVLYDSLHNAGDLEGMVRWKPRVEAELEGNPLMRANAPIVSRLLDALIAHERGRHELALSLAATLPRHLQPGALNGWPLFESMIEVGRAEDLLDALADVRNPDPFSRPARLVPLVDRAATYFEGLAYEALGDTAAAAARYERLVAGMGDGLRRIHFLADAPDRLAALRRPGAAPGPAATGQAAISFEYEPVDSLAVVPLREYVREGRARIEAFFGRPFPESFVFRVLPTREAYDRHAAEKWGMSQTACWMVGGAEDEGVVLVSPRLWTPECDHDPTDSTHVRDLVVHELVHVYHMQNNPSNEFEGADEVGWFVEGLATYASGQLEHGHAARAREAVETGAVPEHLANAWSGPYRYGVSGSLAAFVDERVGRAGLVELLGATTQAEILDRMGMTESELLAAWEAWVRGG